jgi:hypothetical protein
MFHRFLTKFSAAAVPCRGSQFSGFLIQNKALVPSSHSPYRRPISTKTSLGPPGFCQRLQKCSVTFALFEKRSPKAAS